MSCEARGAKTNGEELCNCIRATDTPASHRFTFPMQPLLCSFFTPQGTAGVLHVKELPNVVPSKGCKNNEMVKRKV